MFKLNEFYQIVYESQAYFLSGFNKNNKNNIIKKCTMKTLTNISEKPHKSFVIWMVKSNNQKSVSIAKIKIPLRAKYQAFLTKLTVGLLVHKVSVLFIADDDFIWLDGY